jgi:hypothetical protein
MSKSIHSDDAQTHDYPLRFETTVRWDRPLTHEWDNPERLKERLSKIPVDGDVSVPEFTDTSATVWVETTPEEMYHSVGAILTKVQKVFGNYNRRVIDGDNLTDPPRPRGVKKKHIKCAYEGGSPDDVVGYVSPETWEQAQEIAADLNLEGAPSLEPDISIRTIDGTTTAVVDHE